MPAVTVILPTYNRARFLADAFASIEAQTFRDWELIVVDDGSTDHTREVVQRWMNELPDEQRSRVAYVYRRNGGAYAARNTGLDRVTGDFVAFFDSDDVWLPHHLERGVAALASAPEVDWVYAACRCIDAGGNVVQATTFEVEGQARPFLALATKHTGELHIIDDPDVVVCQLLSGLYSGLQNSVIRRRVFDADRFWEEYRVVEDVLFLTRKLLRGLRIGYLTDIHVLYRIHEGNSSGSAAGASRDALYRIRRESVVGLERIQAEMPLDPRHRRALRRALANYYFWDLGYVCSLPSGDWRATLDSFHKGLRLTPADLKKWKTYFLSLGRLAVGVVGRRAQSGEA